nr:MAG TPA: hypothetical protein [Caudoviricetes sp.]
MVIMSSFGKNNYTPNAGRSSDIYNRVKHLN